MKFIRHSSLPEALRIVDWVTAKFNTRESPIQKSCIRTGDAVLNELGCPFVSQILRTSLSIHTVSMKDIGVHQAFRITFVVNSCTLKFLNAGNYVQKILGNCKRRISTCPKVFEVLMWLHCINFVSNRITKKNMFARRSYLTGNLIGIVVHYVCSAWTKLFSAISNESLSCQVLPYLIYNDNTGCFEPVSREEGFASEEQLTSLVPSGPVVPVGEKELQTYPTVDLWKTIMQSDTWLINFLSHYIT